MAYFNFNNDQNKTAAPSGKGTYFNFNTPAQAPVQTPATSQLPANGKVTTDQYFKRI